jgi:hypothetical protein
MQAQYLMRCAERDRDAAERKLTEERAAHTEEYRRMQSENERLREDLVAKFYNQHGLDAPRAGERKKEVLAEVANGDLCRNAAMPPDEMKQYAAEKLERIESQCQSNQ